MNYLLVSAFVLGFSVFALGQSIKLTGAVFDPNGAIIVGADVKAVAANKEEFSTKSKWDGIFLLQLVPGSYSLQFASPGFNTKVINEYHIAYSGKGVINYDVVLSLSHDEVEPCGPAGACLNDAPIEAAERVEPSDRVSYRPTIKETEVTSRKIQQSDWSRLTILTGKAFDHQGARIAGIKVRAYSRNGLIRENFTNEEGVFSLNLPDGEYKIEFCSYSFETLIFKNYHVGDGFASVMNLDVALSTPRKCRVTCDPFTDKSAGSSGKRKSGNTSH